MEWWVRKFVLAIAAAAVAVPTLSAPVMAHGYDGKVWRDSQGRYRCIRPDGTTGLVARGAGSSPIGRVTGMKSERATGTILGAAAGALLGRRIERDRVRCR
jgi:hypothetical protein